MSVKFFKKTAQNKKRQCEKPVHKCIEEEVLVIGYYSKSIFQAEKNTTDCLHISRIAEIIIMLESKDIFIKKLVVSPWI